MKIVGALGERAVDGTAQYLGAAAGIGAHMGVGEMCHAQSFKLFRQIVYRQRHVLHLYIGETYGIAIDKGIDHIPREPHPHEAAPVAAAVGEAAYCQTYGRAEHIDQLGHYPYPEQGDVEPCPVDVVGHKAGRHCQYAAEDYHQRRRCQP